MWSRSAGDREQRRLAGRSTFVRLPDQRPPAVKDARHGSTDMNVRSRRFRSTTLRDGSDALGTGLGWFSLGLGLAEIVAPRLLTRTLGMQGHERLVQSYGLRELASGAGIPATRGRARAPWMWARVGGDVLDIATVAGALDRPRAPRGNIGAALAALAGVTLLDACCASRLSSTRAQPRPVRRSVRYCDAVESRRPPAARLDQPGPDARLRRVGPQATRAERQRNGRAA
ncbi:MAG: hypothetical protein ACJASC_003374 [Limimaricola cinnabarinus]|jgi:hypothetical protein